MKTTLLTRRTVLAFAGSILIILVSIALAFSDLAQVHPELYAGITYDLILIAPLTLFLLSRRTIPKSVIGLFVSIGIVTAYFIIPISEQFHLNLLRYFIVPVFEFTVVGSIIYFTRKTLIELRKTPNYTRLDHFVLFQQIAIKLLGNRRTGKIFGSEFALFFYVFRWNRSSVSSNEFTSHKTTGSIALIWAFIFMMIVEGIALHVLLIQWSFITTWLLTATSIYGILFLIAHANALRYRPHIVTKEGLELKNGLFGTAIIPFNAIKKVVLSSNEPEDATLKMQHFSLFGKLESHNVIIYLNEPTKLELLYGITKTVDGLMLSIDDKELFNQQIENELLHLGTQI